MNMRKRYFCGGSTALLLSKPLGGSSWRSFVKSWHSMLTACIAAYYVLVIRLSAVYVVLSTQLLLFIFDLAYDLSSDYRSCAIWSTVL